MEKLELKHLAPYLPYGLKLGWISEDRYIVEEKAQIINVESKTIETKTGYEFDIEKNDIRPILRPLSGLTEKEIDYIWFELVSTDDECYNRVELEEMYYNQSIRFCPQFIFEHFLSLHFDVFGLIEKGLAINKNTLTK